jgi:NAD(P)-dependent dehydrogenase (short-subunit alcohol dehydrogenase family)
MSDAFDLAGRVALVTGGSRGLGRGFAAALAGRGANVAITSRTIESLADTQRELEAFGVDVLPCTVDTAKVETIAADGRSGARALRPDRHPGEQRRLERA